jgi:hypothetical protein
MKTILFFVLICLFCNCKAQSSLNTLPKEFYQFAIASGMIEKQGPDTIENYSLLFRIKELVNYDSTMSQQYGIYLFETNTEDSKISIIFKKKDYFELFDISNFGFFMPKLITFLEDSSFSLSNANKLKYIKEVINIYKEISESKNDMIIIENHGRYKFFIYDQNTSK